MSSEELEKDQQAAIGRVMVAFATAVQKIEKKKAQGFEIRSI